MKICGAVGYRPPRSSRRDRYRLKSFKLRVLKLTLVCVPGRAPYELRHRARARPLPSDDHERQRDAGTRRSRQPQEDSRGADRRNSRRAASAAAIPASRSPGLTG